MRVRMEEQNRLRAEAESAARAQQTEQKMTFQRQQKEKQAQSEEMKIMQHQQQVISVRSATFFVNTLCSFFHSNTDQSTGDYGTPAAIRNAKTADPAAPKGDRQGPLSVS